MEVEIEFVLVIQNVYEEMIIVGYFCKDQKNQRGKLFIGIFSKKFYIIIYISEDEIVDMFFFIVEFFVDEIRQMEYENQFLKFENGYL